MGNGKRCSHDPHQKEASPHLQEADDPPEALRLFRVRSENPLRLRLAQRPPYLPLGGATPLHPDLQPSSGEIMKYIDQKKYVVTTFATVMQKVLAEIDGERIDRSPKECHTLLKKELAKQERKIKGH